MGIKLASKIPWSHLMAMCMRKYEEAEVDRLVAILKTNNCGGGGAAAAEADRVKYSKQPASARAAQLLIKSTTEPTDSVRH